MIMFLLKKKLFFIKVNANSEGHAIRPSIRSSWKSIFCFFCFFKEKEQLFIEWISCVFRVVNWFDQQVDPHTFSPWFLLREKMLWDETNVENGIKSKLIPL